MSPPTPGGRRGRRRRRQAKSTVPSSAVPRPTAARAVPPPAESGVAARPKRGPRRRPEPTPEQRGRLYRLTHPRRVAEIIGELRLVTWPSRLETRNLTIVVLIVAISVGVFLGVIDWAFSRVMENVLLR